MELAGVAFLGGAGCLLCCWSIAWHRSGTYRSLDDVWGREGQRPAWRGPIRKREFGVFICGRDGRAGLWIAGCVLGDLGWCPVVRAYD